MNEFRPTPIYKNQYSVDTSPYIKKGKIQRATCSGTRGQFPRTEIQFASQWLTRYSCNGVQTPQWLTPWVFLSTRCSFHLNFHPVSRPFRPWISHPCSDHGHLGSGCRSFAPLAALLWVPPGHIVQEQASHMVYDKAVDDQGFLEMDLTNGGIWTFVWGWTPACAFAGCGMRSLDGGNGMKRWKMCLSS